MKGNMRKSVLLAVVAMLVLVVFTPVANTQGPEGAGKSADKGWSALDNVDRLKDTLEKAGFTLLEGVVEYMDWVMETCELHMRDTAFNNPAPNAYATLILPPPPGGETPPEDGGKQVPGNPPGTDPDKPQPGGEPPGQTKDKTNKSKKNK